jgi:hypothetical protein
MDVAVRRHERLAIECRVPNGLILYFVRNSNGELNAITEPVVSAQFRVRETKLRPMQMVRDVRGCALGRDVGTGGDMRRAEFAR